MYFCGVGVFRRLKLTLVARPLIQELLKKFNETTFFAIKVGDLPNIGNHFLTLCVAGFANSLDRRTAEFGENLKLVARSCFERIRIRG